MKKKSRQAQDCQFEVLRTRRLLFQFYGCSACWRRRPVRQPVTPLLCTLHRGRSGHDRHVFHFSSGGFLRLFHLLAQTADHTAALQGQCNDSGDDGSARRTDEKRYDEGK